MGDLANKIQRIVAAAEALGAPKFSSDLLAAGAAEIETIVAARRTELAAQHGSDVMALCVMTAADTHEDELRTIELAAEVSMAFIACVYLPEELGIYRERDDANQLLIAGIDVATRYARPARYRSA